jgi:hypothetical protein
VSVTAVCCSRDRRPGAECLRNNTGRETQKSKATRPSRPEAQTKAWQAAERRFVTAAGSRTNASAAVRKPAQLDSRQSTLTSFRQSSRVANSDRPVRRYNESSPQAEEDRAVVSVPPPIDKKEL